MEEDSFEPAEESKSILLALEIAKMKWMADELTEVFRRGKQADVEIRMYHGKRSQLELRNRVEPFNPQEQMRLIADAIRAYTYELHEMWVWASHELGEALQLSGREIVLLGPTGQLMPSPFLPEFDAEYQVLNGLLRNLAPMSVDDLPDGQQY